MQGIIKQKTVQSVLKLTCPKLYRYLARTLTINILVVTAVIAMLVFILDSIELLRRGADLKDVNALQLIELSALRVPALLESLFGFMTLIAALLTFFDISKKSELPVMRAAGLSVWQITLGPIAAAFGIGLLMITLYNPVAVNLKEFSLKKESQYFGARLAANVNNGKGKWVRLTSEDGNYLLYAPFALDQGRTLRNPKFYNLSKQDGFLTLVSAEVATLEKNAWILKQATVFNKDEKAEHHDEYVIPTELGAAQASSLFARAGEYSFWQLPELIETNIKTGQFSAHLVYAFGALLILPVMYVTMVLLGASLMLRHMRSTQIFTQVLKALLTGFGLYILLEITKDFGASGIFDPKAMAVLPTILTLGTVITVLLFMEEG